PEGGVDAHLVRDLVRGADPDRAAVADVGALGALAHDDEVDLARLGERGRDAREELRGAQVDVVVELEAQAQQEAALEDTARDVRVADGAEQDRVVLADRREVLVGEGLARAVPACGAEVELGRRDLEVGAREGCVEDGEPLLDHFGSDAVAAHDGELHTLRHAVHPTPRPTCRTPGLDPRTTSQGSTRPRRRRPAEPYRATDDDGAPGRRPRDVGRPDPCGPGRPGRSEVGACAEPDQRGVMFDAWGPLGPCVTSNSTFWFSSSEREPPEV